MQPLLASVVPRTLAWPDYLALAAYFALNLGIGWWCARRKHTSSGDFFLGRKRLAWWAMAISFFATATSSISFMALPAKTYATDWMAFGAAPAQAIATVLVGLFFVALLRRLNMTTIYLYLEHRFDRRVRLLAAVLGMLVKVFGRMGVVMLLPALALSTVTGLNVYLSILLMGVVTTLYAMEGGFEAVIWTDVLQAGVMLGGVVIALFHLIGGVDGGFSGVIAFGNSADKFRMVSWAPDITQPTVWVFGGLLFSTIFIQIADQPLMQRVLATTDEREARRTVVLGSAIGMISSIVFFFVGTALWAFYRAHPERLAAGLANDAILPYFIANEMPTGLVGLIVAGLFAAAMGALSSILNSMAAIIVSDFQAVWLPHASARDQLRLARFTTLVCGLLGTAMACWLAGKNVASLWDEFMKLIALLGGGVPGIFALGLLTRRANAAGAIVGGITAIAATWWVQTFTQVNVFLHATVALATCFVVGYGVSLLRPAPQRNLAGLTLFDLQK